MQDYFKQRNYENMKKNLNFSQIALLNEIKTYNDEMRWDSYYFEGYQHDAEPHTLEEAGEAYLDDKDFGDEYILIERVELTDSPTINHKGYSFRYIDHNSKKKK